MNINNAPCPCHSGKKYKKCCRRYHEQGVIPETPELLMRSRYAAYSLCMVDYIMATTSKDGSIYDPNTDAWRANIELFSKNTSFDGLEILETKTEGDTGWVEFIATLIQRGQDASFKELSRFVRRDGRWYYADAESNEDLGPAE